MSKHAKKGKGPQQRSQGPKFDENALSQLTSKLERNLSAVDNKRKNPPTNDSGSKNQKRQRSENGPAKKSAAVVDDSALLAEIKALGGDEEDLKLIADVDSSDEEYVKDDKRPMDKKLKDEVAALSKQLGLAEHEPSEASDAEEDDAQPQQDEEDVEEEEDDDDEDEEEDEQVDENMRRKAGNLTFEPRADWHAVKMPKLPSPVTTQTGPFTGAIESLKQHANTLLDADGARYRTSVFASSSHKFLSTIMSSGTLTDKVSALTLAIQESPVHNIRAFDALMTLASKKSRAQAIGAIGALVDLLGPGTILPPNRRLRPFNAQPGLLGTLQKTAVKSWSVGQPLPGKISEAQLIAWTYEDWLKETYFKIIQLLEVWCSDEIEYSRTRSLDFIYGLLKEKPEQESNLLRLLVNKLGDRDRKISSRASYLLLQLQNTHPGMKPIIIRTVEQEIILHPSQDHRSKYYAINTLNQTILSSKETEVAESLIKIYFELFVTLLKSGNLGIGDGSALEGDQATKSGDKKKGKGKPGLQSKGPPASEQVTETADKLVSAILTGANRAAPFVSASGAIMESHLDTLFKIAHSTNFNTGIQALLLIQHLSSSRNMAMDRFYRTLYESLLDPRLVTSSKQALYLNLLLRALKNDVDVRRVKAFAKRMLQVAELHQAPFVCGLLYVIAHLRGTFPDLSTLIEDPEESIFDDEAAGEKPVYDGRKRDPEHSNAHRSCLWEMVPIQSHFHPAVSVFAKALSDRDSKVQKPDIESHSLIRFLDKFVYRNPKATDSARGVSIMQPLRSTKDTGDIWLGSRGATGTTSVNSAQFWNKKVEDVAAEDAFFHNYFQQVGKETKTGTKTGTAAGGDDEDEDEDEIWKALVSAQPDIEDDASDVGFDDLDEEDMASDDDSPALSLDEDDDDLEGLDDDDMSLDLEGDDDDEDAGSGGLVEFRDDDDEEGSDEETGEGSKGKGEKDARRERRKALKNLPTFASVDDYAQLLEGDDEDL